MLPDAHPASSCAPTPTPSPLPYSRLYWRAGSEPALLWKRTRMTQIKRIFADFLIRANPCHPCNPCSILASLFAEAPQINKLLFIKLIHQSLPNKKEQLLAPPLLRTVRETFASYRSSVL